MIRPCPRSTAMRAFRTIHTTTRDVLIVGAGPAGLGLAATLKANAATRHLDVEVVEGQSIKQRLSNWAETTTPGVYENRVSSLTPHTTRNLADIGVWDHVVADRVAAYDEMRVWDGSSGTAIEFDAFSSPVGHVATMCENSNLQQALLTRFQSLGGQVRDGARVSKITTDAHTGWPVVQLGSETPKSDEAQLEAQPEKVKARLLVGADGQQSPVRSYAGIESSGWDYERFGVVATLNLEYDNLRTCAFQRFLRTGPVALLPLPDSCATLVWSTTPKRAHWLRQLEPQAFVAVVNAAFRLDMADLDYLHTRVQPEDTATIVDEVTWRLDERLADERPDIIAADDDTLPVPISGVQEGSVAAFPLRMRHVDSYVGDRVALIGDAAHTTHPLAGQGLNMGQRDVEALAEAISNATVRGLDIGSPLALEPFPRAVYAKNHVTIGVADKLHKLYGTDWWPVVAVRSAGLAIANASSTVKSFLVDQASR